MKNKRQKWLIISVVAVFLLIISFLKWGLLLNPAAEALTEKEAQQLIEERYKGKVTNIGFADDKYIIQLERNQEQYELKLDAKSAEVIYFSKMEDQQKNPNNNESTQENSGIEPSKSTLLTEKELKKKILLEEPGELIFFKKIEQNIYKAIVSKSNQRTILKVDASSGEIIFRKIEVEKEAYAKITEEQAGQIALEQVQGNVNDIDFEDEDNLIYYLVEIDTSDDREAIVQIDAITGEILSVYWDD